MSRECINICTKDGGHLDWLALCLPRAYLMTAITTSNAIIRPINFMPCHGHLKKYMIKSIKQINVPFFHVMRKGVPTFKYVNCAKLLLWKYITHYYMTFEPVSCNFCNLIGAHFAQILNICSPFPASENWRRGNARRSAAGSRPAAGRRVSPFRVTGKPVVVIKSQI